MLCWVESVKIQIKVHIFQWQEWNGYVNTQVLTSICIKLCKHVHLLRSVHRSSSLLRAELYWSIARICLEVDSSFKCLVVNLRAFSSPSTLSGACSFKTFMQPFISILDVLQKAPTGWTWSYRMITPTMTLMQNISVSSLVNLLLYSGVSSMTLQTLVIVLRQSVVFSIGRVLFSETKCMVALLRVFSIGVASA